MPNSPRKRRASCASPVGVPDFPDENLGVDALSNDYGLGFAGCGGAASYGAPAYSQGAIKSGGRKGGAASASNLHRNMLDRNLAGKRLKKDPGSLTLLDASSDLL